MLLNLGLSGVAFVGSDVGGYSGNATAELFARWMAVGSFSPFFRNHVTSGVPSQEPWVFGTEVEDVSRAVIQERYELLPYLYSLFAQNSTSGEPILRPMVYEFQDDSAGADLDDQAMFGPFILVAPVMTQGVASRTVYLPAGRWFEAKSGAIFDGPTTVTVGLTLASLPTFIRDGAIIPRGPTMQWSNEKPMDPLFLDIYPSTQSSSFDFYEDEGDGFAYQQSKGSKITYLAQKDASGATIKASARTGAFIPPARSLKIRVRRVDHEPTAVTWSGTALAKSASIDDLQKSGSGYFYDSNDLSVVILHPDSDSFELRLTYDPTIPDPRPAVNIEFLVHLPVGTPTSTPISVSSSANGWSQQATLDWIASKDTAHGYVSVPRGEWFFYKYTRGSWATVEKWSGCAEATNRYGFGTSEKVREESVATWADWCP
jgi:alpha-glucosidase